MVQTEARPLNGADVLLDPATRARVDQEVAAAYEQGRQDGRREAEAAAARAGSAVVAQVEAALDRAHEELAASRAEDGARALDLAIRIAEELVGVSVAERTTGLVTRVQQVLAAVDDTDLVLHASPDEVHVLSEELRHVAGLTVEMDPSLGHGEARITGPWSDADLTWDATWASIRSALSC